jgi:hypothetical protein
MLSRFKKYAGKNCPVGVYLLAIFLGILVSSSNVSALSGSEFNPANILDDAVFFNHTSMSANDIQVFLNTKVSTCDTWGTQPYAGTTRAAYGASRGYPAPFTCIKDYSQSIPAKSADTYCVGTVAPGTKSAAQIIYDVSQACRINPKVLIVLLQKEQALITDDWPWTNQYTKATGFYCPDDPNNPGWCDPAYAGFFNQVYNAARQLNRYIQQPSYFNFASGRTSYISYQANAPSCGGTNVNIQNGATAALYNYTPYQPNTAALNNLYGTGDSCSAYGNRNFWRMFNDWFGSTKSNLNIGPSDVNWKFENLLGKSTGVIPSIESNGGTPASISYGGKLFVFSYNYTKNTLELIVDNSGWSKQTLDGQGGTCSGSVNVATGLHPSVAIYNNKISVAYHQFSDGKLRVASINPDDLSCSVSTIDGTVNLSISGSINSNLGSKPSITSYSGSLQVFYYDQQNGNLRHAWHTATGGWKTEDLDGASSAVSGFNSNTGSHVKTFVYNDSLRVFYYDQQNGNLRHAWTSPTQGWKFENLDGSTSSVSRSESNSGMFIAGTQHLNGIQLFYYNGSSGNLRHAWTYPGQSWKFENLDGDAGSIGRAEGNSGIDTTIAIRPSDGRILLFYKHDDSLKYVYSSPQGWTFTYLDGTPYSISGYSTPTGTDPTFSFYGSSYQLFYQENGKLIHSWAN